MGNAAKTSKPQPVADLGIDAAAQTIAQFNVRYVQYLDENANIRADLPEFANNNELLMEQFRTMLLMRRFDHKVLMLHRTGKIGTYPGTKGQEAIGIGMAQCLNDTDILVPYYRSITDLYVRGAKLHEILAFWIGDERSMNFQDPRLKHDLPLPICIGTQLPHAAGVATTMKLRGQKNRAVLTAIGDGGTSQGDFYEGLNVAGAWHLPLVCVINNNHWALTEPTKAQTGCATLAQKAVAAGIEGIQVDGNDIIAVQAVVDYAMQKARSGGGATLIEALTYRLCAHTTMDSMDRYIEQDEYDAAETREPIARLRTLLQSRGVLDDSIETRMENDIKEEIELEVETALTMPPQAPEDMFDYLYSELPERLAAQRAEVIAREAAKDE